VLVCIGVSGTVRNASVQLSQHEWHVRPAWLVAAGIFYGIGLAPMGWFWNRALSALGQSAPLTATMRSYYLGHIGKYVPGKAMAVILRVAGVRPWVKSLRVAIVSALLETLTMMSVGAFLAAALSTVVLRLDLRLSVIAIAMAAAAGMPTLPPIARRLARLGMARVKDEANLDEPPAIPADVAANLHGIDFRLLASGWLAAGVCWIFLGLSLWACLRAIGVDNVAALADLPRLVAAVAISVVAGFLSMLPGGLGVRDAFLIELLARDHGAANALVVTVILRLVWLVTELVVCGILYISVPIGTNLRSRQP
jgi:glycosyltransferase 2 family protein